MRPRWYEFSTLRPVDRGAPEVPARELALWRLRQHRAVRNQSRLTVGMAVAYLVVPGAMPIWAIFIATSATKAGANAVRSHWAEISESFVVLGATIVIGAAGLLLAEKRAEARAWVSRPTERLLRREKQTPWVLGGFGLGALGIAATAMILGDESIRYAALSVCGLCSFVGASALGWAGFRWRRGDEILCATCGYTRDVGAIGTDAPCPECGRLCRTVRDLRMGRPGICSRLLWSAAACLAVGLLVLLLLAMRL